jgi:hypothetical protein
MTPASQPPTTPPPDPLRPTTPCTGRRPDRAQHADDRANDPAQPLGAPFVSSSAIGSALYRKQIPLPVGDELAAQAAGQASICLGGTQLPT